MKRLSSMPTHLVILITLMTMSFTSHAHNRSQSFSDWIVADNRIEAIFTVKTREITRLQSGPNQALDVLLSRHLAETIRVFHDKQACKDIAPPRLQPSAQGYVRVGLYFDCGPQIDTLNIKINSFFSVASAHVHYAQIAVADQLSQQYIFSDDLRRQEIDTKRPVAKNLFHSIAQYTTLGIEHIFGGIDHIAFLLALILLLRKFSDLVWIVTGFTLGHSVTLCLATLGFVIPDLAVIEATIGFTIALVALDNAGVVSGHRHYFAYALIGILMVMLLFNLTSGAGLSALSIVGLIILTLAYMPLASSETKSANFRPVMAIAFGLIHGFGFASALAEIGLSGAQLWPALLGFNLGIEVGQLMIIAGLWLVLKQLNEKNQLLQPRLVVDLVSASLCGLGFYWFIGRSYGII
ncbi:MAG: HupE/UreJ family protein [Porticoccaceae bacterium]|nr:HupE/UreJ family protein [Porticoccaceae bacterium]